MATEEYYVEISFGKGNAVERIPWSMRETFSNFMEAKHTWRRLNSVLDELLETVSKRLDNEAMLAKALHKRAGAKERVPLTFPSEPDLLDEASKRMAEKAFTGPNEQSQKDASNQEV